MLRYYIRQLRHLAVHVSTPPFQTNGLPQECNGRLFNSSGSGPFSYHELSRWYQNRLLVMQQFRKEDLGVAPFDGSMPLMSTHLDLHPCNIRSIVTLVLTRLSLHLANMILGDDRQLWVIDRATSGIPRGLSHLCFFSETHPDTLRS